MLNQHSMSGTNYRARLTDVIKRAKAFEDHAHTQYAALAPADAQRVMWARIERRYATIRGNAEHLLDIYERQNQRQQPFFRLKRYLKSVVT
jgi:hypothetical protein